MPGAESRRRRDECVVEEAIQGQRRVGDNAPFEPFEIEGSATVRAIAVRDNFYDSEIASFTVTRPTWTFGDYLNCPERTFSTGGDAEWGRAKGVSADGYALKSGDITHSQTSHLETVCGGFIGLSFARFEFGESRLEAVGHLLHHFQRASRKERFHDA